VENALECLYTSSISSGTEHQEKTYCIHKVTIFDGKSSEAPFDCEKVGEGSRCTEIEGNAREVKRCGEPPAAFRSKTCDLPL